MREYKKSKLKSKTLILICIIILIAVNSGILFSYYYFYISDKMENDLIQAKNQNYQSVYNIAKSIEGKKIDDAINVIKTYISKNGGYLTLKDSSGEVIYTNKNDKTKVFSSTIIVYINGNEYEITYSKISMLPGLRIIRGFIFYEIITVSLISIVVFYISTKKLIDPIETITTDINNYKFGRRPFKRKMPKKMQKIQNTFVDMVDTLEIEKEHQNQIIASISHDIKTPLTSVIGYADRLKNNNLSDDKKLKYIDKIYNKSLLIKGILEEFDDYQSCNIKETMKFETVKVKEICDTIKKDFEEELYDKKISLIVECKCNEDQVLIDNVKIKRVFSNIIANTVRHLKQKSGVIRLNIRKENNKVYFEIADTAGGILDDNELRKIFEPFYTTDPSRKISGLGLSICKQIVTAHNGRIYAKNNDIGGLTISFILPLNNFNKI